MALPLIVPVAGGIAAVLGGLLIRKQILAHQKSAPASAAAVAALPPAVQAVVNSPGAPVNQATINSLAVQQAAGTLDVANLLKGANGVVFTKSSPLMAGVSIPDDIAKQISAGDTLTIDVGGAGLQIATVTSGNALFVAQGPADMTARTIAVKSVDPRTQDHDTVLTLPIAAITGIQP